MHKIRNHRNRRLPLTKFRGSIRRFLGCKENKIFRCARNAIHFRACQKSLYPTTKVAGVAISKHNKAQIHMMETIAVLLIFFVIVLIGFTFYARVMQGNLEIKQEEARQLKAIEVAQRAMFFPELQCSKENIVATDCIDIWKLDAAADIMGQNQIYYHDRLGFSKVVIDEIYPDSNSWVLYDRSLDKFQDKITSHLPISIFHPEEKKYSFGVMEVDVYIQ